MQRIILCRSLHPREHFFAAKHGNGVAVYQQPAGSLFARQLATLPLNEAVRAVNDMNRASRERFEAACTHLDLVLP